MAETTGVPWQDVRDWGVEGQGWSDTLCPYDRRMAGALEPVLRAVLD
jgi:hypothetical protein